MMKRDYESKPRPAKWHTIPDDMWEWATALEKWGRRVREDIVRIEEEINDLQKRAGVPETTWGTPDRAAGDPGDPPPPPWKK